MFRHVFGFARNKSFLFSGYMLSIIVVLAIFKIKNDLVAFSYYSVIRNSPLEMKQVNFIDENSP